MLIIDYFDLAVSTIDCAVFSTISQLFLCDLVKCDPATCVLTWYRVPVIVCFVLRSPGAVDRTS